MLKDYDKCVLYHPNKVNVVTDALNRMTMGSVSHVEETKKHLWKYVHGLACLGVKLEYFQVVILWFIVTPSSL